MDFGEMMRNVKAMTGRLQEAQAEARQRTVEGASGGGMVTARMNGAGEMTGLEIDPSVIDPSDPEMLADLVIAAVNDARRKADASKVEMLQDMAGGMDLSALGIDPKGMV